MKKSLLKKLIAVALVATTSIVSLAGCGSTKSETSAKDSAAPATDKKVTITFWNGFTASDGDILKDIVSRFNQKNSGKIEIKMDVMPWDTLYQKLPPSMATNTAPSFVLMSSDNIPQYVANNSIQPLDDFWTSTGLKESDYVQNVLDLVKTNGKYYGMPMQENLIYLYWNKDRFKDAGLDPEKPPVTLDEMGKFAEKLTNSSKNQFGLGMPISGAPQYWTSFIWNNGGEFFDVNQKKALINSPENIKTLAWIQDLAVNKKVTPKGATGADLDNLFNSGQLGMYINGPWLVNGLKKNNVNFGIAAIPKGSSKQQVIAGGIGFAIPTGTKEDEKKAVYEFMKYWMSPEILKEWSMKNGFPAWSNSVINDSDIKADKIQSAISPLGNLGRNYTLGLSNGSMIDNDAMWPMMELILNGSVKPEDAVKKTSDKIDEIFKSSK